MQVLFEHAHTSLFVSTCSRLRGLLMAVGGPITADRLTVHRQNDTVNVPVDQQLHGLLIRDQQTS